MENFQLWILGSYALGSLVGFLMYRRFYKSKLASATGFMLDTLIESGYIRTEKNEQGEVIILPYKEEIKNEN